MKKVVCFLLLLVVMPLQVFADNYNKNDLIAVDSMASVDTDIFSYNDFIYNSQIDSNGNCYISFNSILNKTSEKKPVSINILLFDQEKKNIGLVSYCSLKDYGNQYEKFELDGGSSHDYSIKVTSKFISSKNTPSDVKYIAVMDENEYCHIGGYTRYEGLTIDMIIGNKKANNTINNFFSDEKLMRRVIYISLIIVSLLIIGALLNSLYSQLYGNSTILAYIPVLNIFVLYRVAFGNVIGIIGFLTVCVFLGLSFIFKVLLIPAIIFIIIPGFVDIIKLITKNYNLFLFGNNLKKSSNNVSSSISPESNTYSRPIDLTYSSSGVVSSDNNTLDDDNTSINTGGVNNTLIDNNSNINNNNSVNQNNNGVNPTVDNIVNNNEESDLTNLYK